MSSRTKALIAILIASLLWSSSATVPKILFLSAPPFTVAFERFFIASLLILPLVARERKPKHYIRTLLPLGLFNAGNILFYYAGLSLTTANTASILGTTVPLVVTLLSYLLLGETVSKQKLFGIIVGLAGALLIVALPILTHTSVASGSLLGNLFLVGSTLSWTMYILYSRSVLAKGNFSPLLSTSMNIGVVTICTGIAALFFRQPLITPALLQSSYVLLLLFAAIAITLVTFFLFQWGVQHVSAATASLKEYIQLVFGVGINTFVLHEQLTGSYIVGSILVALGVFIATSEHLTRKTAAALFTQSE